jgi:ankyrin repeat protein
MEDKQGNLHHVIDWDYGPDGDEKIKRIVAKGADVNGIDPETGEAPIHVAARRRRLDATKVLLELGADIDLKTVAGKTAYAHALRRRFDELARFLANEGADTTLNTADRLAVAVVNGRLSEAEEVLREDPGAVRTGNPEEDRLFADIAGRADPEPVRFLIAHGADLTARGLDDGTPLHQAAWFGEPDNAALLIEAGAALDIFDNCHNSSPLHWAVHGSRYSGHAAFRQKRYMALVEMLLDAGSSLHYPDDESDSYLRRLFADATESVRKAMIGRGLSDPED